MGGQKRLKKRPKMTTKMAYWHTCIPPLLQKTRKPPPPNPDDSSRDTKHPQKTIHRRHRLDHPKVTRKRLHFLEPLLLLCGGHFLLFELLLHLLPLTHERVVILDAHKHTHIHTYHQHSYHNVHSFTHAWQCNKSLHISNLVAQRYMFDGCSSR